MGHQELYYLCSSDIQTLEQWGKKSNLLTQLQYFVFVSVGLYLETVGPLNFLIVHRGSEDQALWPWPYVKYIISMEIMADKQMWAKPVQQVEPWQQFFTQIYAQMLKNSIEKYLRNNCSKFIWISLPHLFWNERLKKWATHNECRWPTEHMWCNLSKHLWPSLFWSSHLFTQLRVLTQKESLSFGQFIPMKHASVVI